MKLASISDLHANFEAIRSMVSALSDVGAVLCLGDLLGYFTQVNETMWPALEIPIQAV